MASQCAHSQQPKGVNINVNKVNALTVKAVSLKRKGVLIYRCLLVGFPGVSDLSNIGLTVDIKELTFSIKSLSLSPASVI